MNPVEAPRDWRQLQAGALTEPPNLTSALPSKWKGQAKVILISSDWKGAIGPNGAEWTPLQQRGGLEVRPQCSAQVGEREQGATNGYEGTPAWENPQL